MGGFNSSDGRIQRDLDDLKTQTALQKIEHQKRIKLLENQLEVSRIQRNEALDAMKRLEATLKREKEESAKEIAKLKSDQDILIAEVKRMMAKFEQQEAMYKAQLEEAQAENRKLSEQITALMLEMRQANAENARVMAENQTRHEALVRELMAAATSRGDAMMDEIKRLREENKNKVEAVTASSAKSFAQMEEEVMFESKMQEAALNRQICRVDRMLDQTLKFEVQSIADLVQGQPIAGPILANIVQREAAKRANAGRALSSCGSYGEFFPLPRAMIGATAVPSIA